MCRRFYSIPLILLFTLPLVKPANGAPLKKLNIQGTLIFSENEVIIGSGLTKLLNRRKTAPAVIKSIRNFYRARGYDLVTIYLIRNTRKSMDIFIDEGRLGKIVFQNINTLDFIRIRYDFHLRKKVFNRYRVRKELANLRKSFGYKKVTYRIREIKNYDRSFFQLDRNLKVPTIISRFIPYLETYAPRYILEVQIVKRSGGKSRQNGFSVGLQANRGKGFMPEVRYYHHSLLGKGDRLNMGYSAGVQYGLDLQFSEVPRTTYFSLDGRYLLPPLLKNIFTPVTDFKIHHSNQGRADISLEQFRYTRYRITAAPGITLLKKLLLSFGIGYEYINHYTSIPETNTILLEDIPSFEQFLIVKTELTLDIIPLVLGNTIKKSFKLNYDAYIDHVTFHRMTVWGLYDFDLSHHDLLSVRFGLGFNWGPAPLVYEFPVSHEIFKGFQGRGYYSNHISALSMEYRLSIYRDYIFAGVFGEGTLFKASGRDLSGVKMGIIGGVSFRVILFDQFETVVYLGQDWLVATKKTQFNGYFSLTKKW